MKLNRTQVFIAGLSIILAVYLVNRLSYTIGAEKIKGTFAFYISEEKDGEQVAFPILEFSRNDSICQFRGREGTSYDAGEEVNVLLLKGDSDQPMLYTISDFWMYPLVYYILPLAIWSALCYSYIEKHESVIFSIHKPFIRKVF